MRLFVLLTTLLITTATNANNAWPLPGVPDSVFYDLEEAGCDLDSSYFYSDDGFSLKDVNFYLSNGYSATLLSTRGLLLTTYSAVEAYIASGDSLTGGFYAIDGEDEIPLPRLRAMRLREVKDLTDRIMAATEGLRTKAAAKHAKDSVIDMARLMEQASSGAVTDVKTGIDGRTVMYVYESYSDLRLCYLPPRYLARVQSPSIYGAGTGHDADFALLRIYASPDGTPGAYSEDNQPAEFERAASISSNPGREGDPVFVTGFPGGSKRTYLSARIREQVEIDDVQKLRAISFFDSLGAYDGSPLCSPAGEGTDLIERRGRYLAGQDVIAKKAAEEEAFTLLAANDPDFDACLRYAPCVPLTNLYHERRATAAKNMYLLSYVMLYSDPLAAALMADDLTDANSGDILPCLSRYFYEMNPQRDMENLHATLGYVKAGCDSAYLPEIFATIGEKYKKNPHKYAERIYKKSFMTDVERFDKFLDSKDPAADKDKDPLIELARSINAAYLRAYAEFEAYTSRLQRLQRLYAEGRTLYYPSLGRYAEADYGYRMALGRIEGYSPSDGIRLLAFTKASAVFSHSSEARNDSALFALKAEMDGLNANFLCSADMAAGRMGFGVYDLHGDLIGLSASVNSEFSVYEYWFDPALSRSFAIDLNYIVFLLRDYAGADRLCDELSFGSKAQTIQIKYIDTPAPLRFALKDSLSADSVAILPDSVPIPKDSFVILPTDTIRSEIIYYSEDSVRAENPSVTDSISMFTADEGLPASANASGFPITAEEAARIEAQVDSISRLSFKKDSVRAEVSTDTAIIQTEVQTEVQSAEEITSEGEKKLDIPIHALKSGKEINKENYSDSLSSASEENIRTSGEELKSAGEENIENYADTLKSVREEKIETYGDVNKSELSEKDEHTTSAGDLKSLISETYEQENSAEKINKENSSNPQKSASEGNVRTTGVRLKSEGEEKIENYADTLKSEGEEKIEEKNITLADTLKTGVRENRNEMVGDSAKNCNTLAIADEENIIFVPLEEDGEREN